MANDQKGDIPIMEEAKRRLWEAIQANNDPSPLAHTAEALFTKAGLRKGRLAYRALNALRKDGNVTVGTAEYRYYAPATSEGLQRLQTLTEPGVATKDRGRTMRFMVIVALVVGVLTMGTPATPASPGRPAVPWALVGLGITIGAFFVYAFSHMWQDLAAALFRLRVRLGEGYYTIVRQVAYSAVTGGVSAYLFFAMSSRYLRAGDEVAIIVGVFAATAGAAWTVSGEVMRRKERGT